MRTSARPIKPKTDSKSAKSVRYDGWENEYTGFGTARDRTQASQYVRDLVLQPQQLDALYYGSDIGATIIDAPIEEAFRLGFCLTADDKVQAQEFHEWMERPELAFTEHVKECETFARLFGGSLLVFGTNDGKLDTPLDRNRVNKVDFLLSLDKRWAYPISYYSELGGKLGQPAMYQVTYSTGYATKSFKLHESRCVRFRGVRTDLRRKAELGGWDQSVLQRLYPVMQQFEGGWQAAALLLSDASQGVFEIKDLIKILASKDEAANLTARMKLLDMGRSVARSIMVDAETESFTRVPQTFTGLPDLLDKFMQRLSAAVKIPVSILMGRSASGMNATGDLDIASWQKQVRGFQTNELTTPIRAGLDILQLDKDSPSGGAPIEGLKSEWHKLSETSSKEEAEVRKLTAETDQIYVVNTVFTPEQIAIARAGRGEWNNGVPEINAEALAKEAEQKETFTDPETEDTGTAATSKLTLTPSDLAAICTVNEGRASIGLPPLDGPDGALTLPEFKAKHAAVIAAAANAEAGTPEQPKEAPSELPPETLTDEELSSEIEKASKANANKSNPAEQGKDPAASAKEPPSNGKD
jgi:phage-related protein (TIGR01555 family)